MSVVTEGRGPYGMELPAEPAGHEAWPTSPWPIGSKAGLEPAGELREAFGQGLLAVCREEPRVVVLDGDLGSSTRASLVRKEFPERFYNVGIAEANMVGVAAGLAASGYIPFVTSLGSFLFCNAFDQMRLQVAISKENVKFGGSHSGVSTNREGPTAMGIEDYALGAALGFVVLAPCDASSMIKAVRAAVLHPGPVYVRSSREPHPHIYSQDHCPFEIGRANLLREGRDVTLVGCGLMVPVCLDAAAYLAEEGITAGVLDMHTVCPVDEEALARAAQETGAIVTAEEHLLAGGLGAQVALAVSRRCPVPVRTVALEGYTGSGSGEELMERHHLTAHDVVAAAKAAIAAKKGGRGC